MIFLFFFNDTATTEIYTLSLHDALPIYRAGQAGALALDGRGGCARPRVQHGERLPDGRGRGAAAGPVLRPRQALFRSEEHTSELQSQSNLVCRLLLAKQTMARSLHI